MIERANELHAGLDARLAAPVRFEIGDLARFVAREEYTLVFSNAALHWIDDRRPVLEACYRALVPGGRLVVQMPANYEETAQVTLNQLADEQPWRSILGRTVTTPSSTVEAPAYYRRLLGEIGFTEIDTYYQTFDHPMGSPAEIVEWSRATTLRPFLDALPDEHRERFIACWRERLEQDYGTTGRLTFPFRRLFIWGRRPAKSDGA